MNPIPVICSFNPYGKIKPLYFGIEEDSVLHRIRIDAVLSQTKSVTYKDTFIAGMTAQYIDKLIFKCRCTTHGIQRIIILIYDPVEMIWYVDD